MVFGGYCNMENRTKNNTQTPCYRRISLSIIIDVGLYLFLSIAVLYLFLRGQPHERGFLCDDPSLSLPYRPDAISTPLLLIIGFSVSVLVIIIVEFLNAAELKFRPSCGRIQRVTLCGRGYCVFLVGFVLQQLVIEVVKNQLGFLRPNFFDVCRPQFNRTLCPGFITEYTCIDNADRESEIRDSRQSFPSGHSAFTMYIAVYFSLYIERRLQISFSRVLKIFLQFCLLFLSFLCGLGRLRDNKHHPSDVIVGFVIGLTTATCVFHSVGSKLLKAVDNHTCLAVQTETMSNRCSCEEEPTKTWIDPQTPAPLLQNDYFTRDVA